ncbi:dihydrodipicolinate synthase [Corynebacterium resistens DSM 45100]|uniref:4-hydroxy-tetrahydrodipicolinate synthase n=1 Tax=Corynebacterium resistens (strain DSM 45100 / JCM 12819 / GTC 2026 / SICGH 158) TaxID=662755 RepID=F8DY20_CORRG|nr:4-hydroxy-tetrahydrodipicolinate synthase [Corynebacterium resistens]AEI09578.1 dihydrodipicolinate synthase [Corynebacterium resistens DSM 45100]
MSTGIAANKGAEVFGTISVAMVTPFASDGSIDVNRGVEIATHLASKGCDSLVLAGTTGESPTVRSEEKLDLLRAVRSELGDSVKLIAGSGSYDTAATIEFSKASAAVGADSLLVVTPYYSRPSQEGLYQHFTAVADAVDVPICLYDIPSRSVVPIEPDTIARLAKHPNVQAVKDAKGDLFAAMELMENTDLAWYSGDDPLNLAWLASGATGFISVIGHVAAHKLKELRDSFDAGDLARAREVAVSLAPLQRAQARLGGVSFAKAALKLRGLDVGAPRLPIIEPNAAELDQLEQDLQEAGI